MKKSFIFFSLLLIFSSFVFSQKSADSANRNTAIRCFKLAENCMVGKDWENALNQSELGLSYDDSISDLYYIKALAKINMNENKAVVIDIVNQAFEKDNWVGYSKTGARILLADLLSDTGSYKESLALIDAEPLIFSADAEIIRIKNYYRIGTEQSINQARLKVNSSRRVYAADSRFVNIFFNYELVFLIKNILINNNYDIPQLVQIIADSYIAKLPDYSSENSDLEIMAAFFAEPELRERLVSAIYAKDNTKSSLFPILGLMNGIITEKQALDLFLENSKENYYSLFLDLFVSLLNEEEVINEAAEYFNQFDGTLYIDEDDNLQSELIVKYSLGRPLYISYDYNNDGIRDLYAACDYGAPLYLSYSNPDVEVIYDQYPAVQKISFIEDSTVFKFLYTDFNYEPFELKIDEYIKVLGFDMYVPVINGKVKPVSYTELMQSTASIELPITERPDGKVVYTMLKGQLTFAQFYENNKEYAYCDFEAGLPFVRFADYDNDGLFETYETYDVYNPDDGITYDDNELITKVFSKVAQTQNIYLKEVQIDGNLNTNFEYAEIFLGNKSRVCLWDYDDNGICDIKYTVYTSVNGDSKIEETVFYSPEGVQEIQLTSVDEVPLKMIYKDSEVMIFAGNKNHVYWLENKMSASFEESVLNKLHFDMLQGAVTLVEVENNRVLVIKVFEDYFCKYLEE